jgi:hypothetical protein
MSVPVLPRLADEQQLTERYTTSNSAEDLQTSFPEPLCGVQVRFRWGVIATDNRRLRMKCVFSLTIIALTVQWGSESRTASDMNFTLRLANHTDSESISVKFEKRASPELIVAVTKKYISRGDVAVTSRLPACLQLHSPYNPHFICPIHSYSFQEVPLTGCWSQRFLTQGFRWKNTSPANLVTYRSAICLVHNLLCVQLRDQKLVESSMWSVVGN